MDSETNNHFQDLFFFCLPFSIPTWFTIKFKNVWTCQWHLEDREIDLAIIDHVNPVRQQNGHWTWRVVMGVLLWNFHVVEWMNQPCFHYPTTFHNIILHHLGYLSYNINGTVLKLIYIYHDKETWPFNIFTSWSWFISFKILVRWALCDDGTNSSRLHHKADTATTLGRYGTNSKSAPWQLHKLQQPRFIGFTLISISTRKNYPI